MWAGVQWRENATLGPLRYETLRPDMAPTRSFVLSRGFAVRELSRTGAAIQAAPTDKLHVLALVRRPERLNPSLTHISSPWTTMKRRFL